MTGIAADRLVRVWRIGLFVAQYFGSGLITPDLERAQSTKLRPSISLQN